MSEIKTFTIREGRNFRDTEEWEDVWYPRSGDKVEYRPFNGLSPAFGECVATIEPWSIVYFPVGTHQWLQGNPGLYKVLQYHLFPQ